MSAPRRSLLRSLCDRLSSGPLAGGRAACDAAPLSIGQQLARAPRCRCGCQRQSCAETFEALLGAYCVPRPPPGAFEAARERAATKASVATRRWGPGACDGTAAARTRHANTARIILVSLHHLWLALPCSRGVRVAAAHGRAGSKASLERSANASARTSRTAPHPAAACKRCHTPSRDIYAVFHARSRKLLRSDTSV